jgi:transmembrane sensor
MLKYRSVKIMSAIMNNQQSNVFNFRNMDIEERIFVLSAGLRPPAGKSPQEALELFRSKIVKSPQKLHTRTASVRSLTFRISSVAAGIIVILGIWFLFRQEGNEKVIAERGNHLEHKLPDGSQVDINAGSTIRYDGKGFTAERKISLEGEAFFSVVKGSKFVVTTKQGEITVLGTSFNVFSRDNLFKVSCISGRVRVAANNTSVEIIPGENAELSEGKLVHREAKNMESSTSWMKGEFSYENSPLTQVFGEIERQFNVTFASGDLSDRYFTGTFTNKDLKNTLDIVCIPMGLTYAVGDKGKIYIEKKTKQ